MENSGQRLIRGDSMWKQSVDNCRLTDCRLMNRYSGTQGHVSTQAPEVLSHNVIVDQLITVHQLITESAHNQTFATS